MATTVISPFGNFELTAPQPIQFKVDLGEEIRRFTLDVPRFLTAQETIRKIYNLSAGASFSVKYQDADGDLITISSDLELQEAIKVCGLVRLTIQLAPQSSQPVPILDSVKPSSSSSSESSSFSPVSFPMPTHAVPCDVQSSNCLCQSKEAWKQVKKDKKMVKSQLKSLKKTKDQDGKWERKETLCELKEKLQQLKVQVKQQKQEVKETKEILKEERKNRVKKGGMMIARFVKDVTVPDESEVLPMTSFVKTWRFRNESNKPWPEGSRLLFIGKNSDRLGAPEYVLIPIPVLPKQEINISVPLVAPQEQGRYTAYFRLADGTGKKFGQRVWVMVRVYADSSSSCESSSSEKKKKNNFLLTTEQLNKFGKHLQTLHEMHFMNDRLNVRLLEKHKGSMEEVIVVLLRKQKKVPSSASVDP